jgi:alpha-beta hydrolase superfamily lysophospholipase
MSIVTSADGTQIDYVRTGTGPTVILICAGPTDRNANAGLAELLSTSCTVINYDRRGRGCSGDTAPYSVEREVEDLQAVAAAADDAGEVNLFGSSGGAFLAFRAVAGGLPCARIAAWEPPYVLPGSRPPVTADYAARMTRLAEENNPGQMVELFMTEAVGAPADVVGGMRQAPFWGFLEGAAAPALVYDAQLAGDFSLPTADLARVSCPVLILDGGGTSWMTQAADAAAAAIPTARRQTLTGQPHNFDAAALAPTLQTFLNT